LLRDAPQHEASEDGEGEGALLNGRKGRRRRSHLQAEAMGSTASGTETDSESETESDSESLLHPLKRKKRTCKADDGPDDGVRKQSRGGSSDYAAINKGEGEEARAALSSSSSFGSALSSSPAVLAQITRLRILCNGHHEEMTERDAEAEEEKAGEEDGHHLHHPIVDRSTSREIYMRTSLLTLISLSLTISLCMRLELIVQKR
jgi:hypothetical protein